MRFVEIVCKTVLVCAILVLWGVSATANFAHSLQLAGASEWALVIAGASAGADVLKAGASFMILAAFRRRMWAVAIAALLIWGSTTAWSIRSITGFMSNVMLAEQTVRTKNSDVYGDLKKNLEREEAYLEALQGTTIKTRKDRLSLSDNIKDQRKVVEQARAQFRAATPSTKSDGVTDLGEKFLPNIFSPELSTAITVCMFLLLLELGSNLGFFAFSALCGELREKKKRRFWWRRSEPAKTIDAPAAAEPSIAAPKPKPALAVVPKAAPASLYAFPRPSAQIQTQASDPRIPRDKLRAFLDQVIENHGKGARIATTQMQDAFNRFMGSKVDPSLLGRWLAEFGVNRTVRKDKNGVRYYEMPMVLAA